MTRLIEYALTPQVCALEYAEQRDLAENPERADYYAGVIETRCRRKTKSKKKSEKKKE